MWTHASQLEMHCWQASTSIFCFNFTKFVICPYLVRAKGKRDMHVPRRYVQTYKNQSKVARDDQGSIVYCVFVHELFIGKIASI